MKCRENDPRAVEILRVVRAIQDHRLNGGNIVDFDEFFGEAWSYDGYSTEGVVAVFTAHLEHCDDDDVYDLLIAARDTMRSWAWCDRHNAREVAGLDPDTGKALEIEAVQ